jgi:hypothetical protein
MNDSQVSYDYIQVPLKTFNDQLKAIVKDNKVSRFISVTPLETKK